MLMTAVCPIVWLSGGAIGFSFIHELRPKAKVMKAVSKKNDLLMYVVFMISVYLAKRKTNEVKKVLPHPMFTALPPKLCPIELIF